METKELYNGYKVPVICYGTDIVQYNKSIKGSIHGIFDAFGGKKRASRDKGIIRCAYHAIDYGCNFFDTSRAYGDAEIMLKDVLKKHKREEYYLCTKLDNYSQLRDIPAQKVLEDSLKRLGIDYVDLYLLHWPVEGKYLDYWRQIEKLYENGLCKAIGVSNCKIHHLEKISKVGSITPMINEVELHPLLTENELRSYCNNNKIQIMAYSSTARQDFRLRASRRMEKVCKETGKNLSQIILRWHIQNGIIPIFNTSSIQHFQENMCIFDFELTKEQMVLIDSMNINSRTRYDSDNCEWDRL